jgi:hypothetical protein
MKNEVILKSTFSLLVLKFYSLQCIAMIYSRRIIGSVIHYQWIMKELENDQKESIL